MVSLPANHLSDILDALSQLGEPSGRRNNHNAAREAFVAFVQATIFDTFNLEKQQAVLADSKLPSEVIKNASDRLYGSIGNALALSALNDADCNPIPPQSRAIMFALGGKKAVEDYASFVSAMALIDSQKMKEYHSALLETLREAGHISSAAESAKQMILKKNKTTWSAIVKKPDDKGNLPPQR